MMRKRKKLAPAVLLCAAVALLLLSTVGSARAALTYYSENYAMEVTVSSIGVTLTENGEPVSYRNYIEDGWSDSGTGLLLTALAESEGRLVPGREYTDELGVTNSGAIDSYVRVILYRSWQDGEGRKDTTLSPELIEIGLAEESGWVLDGKASTPERLVLYYTEPLLSGESTPALCRSLRVNPDILSRVREEVSETAEGEVITTSYRYDGYWMCLEAEVDAVQTHSAEDAIRSAWGVGVTVGPDGRLALQ